jgi:hypothetical protein
MYFFANKKGEPFLILLFYNKTVFLFNRFIHIKQSYYKILCEITVILLGVLEISVIVATRPSA